MAKKKRIFKIFLAASVSFGLAFANVAGVIVGKKPQAFSALHQTMKKPAEENKFKVNN